ncbi:DUF2799 domain-containing protein [Oceanisphaera pacifica]|uniref:DUF2799 domain-containing protein n=1 Tax=Oceanisphaera pacifica TaxID=2818389 RepID=A0ABS3NGK1_9GAMM|nr:DUF2799 domain-containing protein [Oceanisphaera pacifica]MBO1519405.1 DUF2799 domain-containing protein [Oceanisphaera pacifica]
MRLVKRSYFFSVINRVIQQAKMPWLAVAVVMLSGCASMTEQECLTANWEDKGNSDGRAGYGLTRLDSHYKACANVGVTPNMQQYKQGREQGLKHYCTPENGFLQGQQGQAYRQVCPTDLAPTFLRAFTDGKQLYDAKQRITDVANDIKEIEHSLSNESDKAQRRYLRQKLRGMNRELQRVRHDRRYLESRLERARYYQHQ